MFNRLSPGALADLNRKFLCAIQQQWDHSEATETQLTKRLLDMLDSGADINAQDNLGWSALTRLAMWDYTKTAIALLDRDADVNAKGNWGTTALQGAAQNNNAELMKLLLDKGATVPDQKEEDSRLMCAAVGGGRINGEADREKKIACVEMLIEKGLKIGPYEKSSAWQYPYLAPYCPGLAEAKEIEAAIEAGDVAKITELAEKGFKPDLLAEFGQDTGLFKAARKGDIAMMTEMIRLGSDLSIMCPYSDRTPLMAAAESGKLEALELLVDSGAEIAAHVRCERLSYDEPPHYQPDLYSSAQAGGPQMAERVAELFAPGIAVQRRTKIMKPLKWGT